MVDNILMMTVNAQRGLKKTDRTGDQINHRNTTGTASRAVP